MINDRILRSGRFILLAVVFYVASVLLPQLLQNVLYFISDHLSLPYDYVDQNLNMFYSLISLVLAGLYGALFFLPVPPSRDGRYFTFPAAKNGYCYYGGFWHKRDLYGLASLCRRGF